VTIAPEFHEKQAYRPLGRDIALAMYTQCALSAGKAAELAGISRMDFERLLGERQIVRSYSTEDLEHDLAWAKSGRNQP
jgi:predicted HTH domain antitoxin